jgi:hypothetical protein
VGAATGASVYINNFLGHKRQLELLDKQEKCNKGDQKACAEAAELFKLDLARDLALIECQGQNTPSCHGLQNLSRIAWDTYKGARGDYDTWLKGILSQNPAGLQRGIVRLKISCIF